MSISPEADAAEISEQLNTIKSSCKVVTALVAHMLKTQELPPPPKLGNPIFKAANKRGRLKPLNDIAEKLACLVGGRTIDRYDLQIIQDIGFEVIIDPPVEEKIKERPPNEN
ncbi:MAG: hypothetical protein V3V74_07390 [Nitrosomonadaceae bacterium]